MAIFGMDPMRFLTEKDPFTRSVMQAVAREASEARKVELHNQAVEIAEAVGKKFGGK